MDAQPSLVLPPRRKNRLLIYLFVLFGLLTFHLAYRYALARSIQTRIDAIHRAGFPATCAELNAWYVQPPPGQNAADVYSNAFAHYQMWTNKDAQFSVPADARDTNKFFSVPRSMRDLLPIVGMAKLPPRTEPLPPEMQKLVAEYLSDNAESLRLLHQAASMKSSRYPIDLNKGAMTLLPHLNRARQAARLLELESIQYAEEQQPQPADESIIASLGVSRSLNQEPTLISYLVRIVCRGITLEGLERVLNRMPLTDEQLLQVATTIQESDNQQAFTRAFVGERCMGVDIFQSVGTGKISLKNVAGSPGDDSAWTKLQIAIYQAAGFLQQDERTYLDIMGKYVKATGLLPRESISAFPTVDDEMQHLPKWRVISRVLLLALDPMAIKVARCEARTRDAQSAIAIERYRLANGKLPDQLTDLVPAFLPSIPTDPFDGKPLRYKNLPKGYVVYSVGEDREDNGGTEKNNKGIPYTPGTDITFTVER